MSCSKSYRKKKRELYETNLRQKLNKPKVKTLKYIICLKEKNEIVVHGTKNCLIFKNYFSIPAQNLVSISFA